MYIGTYACMCPLIIHRFYNNLQTVLCIVYGIHENTAQDAWNPYICLLYIKCTYICMNTLNLLYLFRFFLNNFMALFCNFLFICNGFSLWATLCYSRIFATVFGHKYYIYIQMFEWFFMYLHVCLNGKQLIANAAPNRGVISADYLSLTFVSTHPIHNELRKSIVVCRSRPNLFLI